MNVYQAKPAFQVHSISTEAPVANSMRPHSHTSANLKYKMHMVWRFHGHASEFCAGDTLMDVDIIGTLDKQELMGVLDGLM